MSCAILWSLSSRCFSWALVFDCIEAYAPGFKRSVLARDILTPPDLERIFRLPGGVSGGLGASSCYLPACLPDWPLWALPSLH
jgi:hypothetical protein